MLTSKQKAWFKKRFQEVAEYLELCIPQRDEKGNIIAFTDLSLHPEIRSKDWKTFIKNYAEGRESKTPKNRYSPLVFPDDAPCKTMNFRCDYWKDTPQWGGYGEGYNECPEFPNFCCISPNNYPSATSQPEPVGRRATCARKCSIRLAKWILERGEDALGVKDVCRYCKNTCHRYTECIEKKTLLEEFLFCQWVANQITEDTIAEIDKIIEACS